MSCDAESVASKIWGRDQALIEPTTRPLMTLPEPAGTQCLHERITCQFTHNISEACMNFYLILYQFYGLFKIIRRVTNLSTISRLRPNAVKHVVNVLSTYSGVVRGSSKRANRSAFCSFYILFSCCLRLISSNTRRPESVS